MFFFSSKSEEVKGKRVDSLAPLQENATQHISQRMKETEPVTRGSRKPAMNNSLIFMNLLTEISHVSEARLSPTTTPTKQHMWRDI